MANTNLLRRKIEYDGIKVTVLSYRMGISRTTLWSRLHDKSEFKPDEEKDICRVLRLNEEERISIFGHDPIRNDILGRR